MNTSDAPGLRIAAAKSAVASLTDSLSPQAEMGIVAFGSTVPSERGPGAGCRDVTTISELAPIGQSDPRSAVDAINAQGWSPVGAALLAAAQPLGTTEGSIIVVSDGESNCRPDPCATAERIREQHPNVTISAIGFKTDSEQLRCIASKGAGIFVTADNTAQLAARLPAIQGGEEANSSLSSDGLYGIAVGETLGTIRNTHPDFPAGSDDGSVVIEWRDCSWHFINGKLTMIEPHDGGATIDGVSKGTPMARVAELYGDPVEIDTDSHRAYFVADQEKRLAFAVTYSGDSPSSGTVTTIVLCTCLPAEPASATTTELPFPSGPVTADTPFTYGGIGSVLVGLPESQLTNAGLNTEPHHQGTCDVIYVPGGARSPTVYVKDGNVLGARIFDGMAYAENGIKVGDALAKVRAAYPTAKAEVIDQTTAGVGVLLLHKPDDPDKYLGFAVAPGTAGTDSATITGIAGGSKDIASFFEVCSG